MKLKETPVKRVMVVLVERCTLAKKTILFYQKHPTKKVTSMELTILSGKPLMLCLILQDVICSSEMKTRIDFTINSRGSSENTPGLLMLSIDFVTLVQRNKHYCCIDEIDLNHLIELVIAK